jgi:predicted nuclease with TOPRIM domain
MLNAEEQMLLEYTIELKQQYERLSEIVDSLERESSRTIDPISKQMKRIKRIESSLAPLRDSYLRRHDHASGEIAKVTDETIELVKTLMPKLASLEKASVDSLRRLFPKIQGSVRAVQMQNAYRGNRHA